MQAIKLKTFRIDYNTLSKRLLAINGFSKKHPYNPYNVKAYVLHNEFGPFAVSIGACLQDALDNAADSGVMDMFLDYEIEDPCYLGNACEPYNLDYVGVHSEVTQYN